MVAQVAQVAHLLFRDLQQFTQVVGAVEVKAQVVQVVQAVVVQAVGQRVVQREPLTVGLVVVVQVGRNLIMVALVDLG
jgi:hypothetical protein